MSLGVGLNPERGLKRQIGRIGLIPCSTTTSKRSQESYSGATQPVLSHNVVNLKSSLSHIIVIISESLDGTAPMYI